MKHVMRLFVIVALGGIGISTADALILCADSGGNLKATASCPKGWTQLDPVSVGLQGPQGPAGPQGPMGPAGATGMTGATGATAFTGTNVTMGALIVAVLLVGGTILLIAARRRASSTR